MKLIVINGAKNSKKNLLALRLASNSDCVWIHPYTDRDKGMDDEDEYIHLNDKQLSDKMEKEVPFLTVEVNENRYVFFENQLNADFVVLIGDDGVVSYLKNNYKRNLITVRCHSDDEKYSERSLLDDSEFDIVYNYDKDDYDYFESEIVYGVRT